jgi:four helix bundle protein
MTYDEWLKSVPPELTEDPLWRMEVFRYALFIGDLSWHDVSKLVEDKRALRLSSQLYSAVGSIAANIAEGYSHRSRKDQARFYEYALGSAREARVWYYQSKNILPATVTEHRLRLLTSIIRMLLTIIPAERGYKMSEPTPSYNPIIDSNLLDRVPFP